MAVTALAACGRVRIGGEATGADLITDRGTPVVFTMECSQRVYDANTASWVQGDRMYRVDRWMYAQPGSHDEYLLINGIIVGADHGDAALDELPNPGIDPRRFGCLEEVDTVVKKLHLGDPDVTTVGSDQEASLLTIDASTRLQGDYYAGKKGTGLLITSVNGTQLIGMVTL